MKKFFTILLALAMTFALSAAAFAQSNTPTTTGSITINHMVKDVDYQLYRIFDLTYVDTSVSYTINEAWAGFFAEGATGAGYLQATQNPEGQTQLNPITIGTETKYINITDSNVAEFANAAAAWMLDQDPALTPVATANDAEGDGTETVENLPLGYYLVYPVGLTQPNENYHGSLCSLDSTLPDATINGKAETPSITKTVDDPQVDVGQIVTFTINGEVPNVNGYDTYNYKVYDTFTNLKYVSDFTITFGEGADAVTVTADIADQVTGIPAADATSFTLDIEMVAFLNAHKGIKAGDKITITYKAEVTDGALTTHDGKNSAHLEYSNNPGNAESHGKTPPTEVKVYTCEVQVNKVKPDGTTPLAGAEFVLYKKVTEENAEKTKYYYWNENDKKVEWVDDIANATKKTSDGTNNISFNGIESGTYWLKETKAPEGYNLLDHDIEVKVSNPPTEAGTNPETPAVEIVHIETVINATGSELPETGGIGTTIFYIIGGLLMVGAVVLLVVRKKMSVTE